ncbi:MAG: phytanoyl-CoA dioxygenase family protein [Minwuia sp.]|uniref:phytanoyl-CoA dioxygenase family protein n=1 Tax=Minwuia sp. TaxID=2493630 RepID=UPI003A85A2FA
MNISPTLAAIGDAERQFYDRNGYLLLEGFIGRDWLERLKDAAAAFVEASRQETESGKVLDLAPGHSADAPRLRRLISPADNDGTFREFVLDGPAAGLASALLDGPVRYHHGKLNFKWSSGGEEIKWHQDIQFWPHTDFSPLTIGIYLEDVDDEMGPMGVLPGSHRGPLYDLFDGDGTWTGAMHDRDAAGLDLDAVAWLKGPAGSVTIHNCCMVHGSAPNNSPRPRPLLLQTYSAAHSWPIAGIGGNGSRGGVSGRVVGGSGDGVLEIEGRRMRVAPDWAGRVQTIFRAQQKDR